MPRYRRKTPEFKRDLVDLENYATKSIVIECKIDACVDKFLVRLRDLGLVENDYDFRLPSTEGETGEKLQDLASELRSDLDRLVPGYLDADTSLDILEVKKVNDRFRARWRFIRKRSRNPQPIPDTDNPDSFLDRLLTTLLAVQDQQRLSTANDPSGGARALTRGAFTEACQQLREAIESETSAASFACGGTIPIAKDATDSAESASEPTSPAVRVWIAGDDSSARRLTLPVAGDAADSCTNTLQDLVAACQPASFGRGGEDVFDPEYRRAGKLEPKDFLTSFHPADYGIIELIEQILLPGVSSDTDNRLQFRKVKAELYKLNVYSGPSGHFRKHVDTPRSEHQIGSLVVCLPSEFEGGNLLVRHHGQETNFDWSRQSGSSIQWAAFYSDCEHEIETIKAGNRITLTYNLYVREVTNGATDTISPILEPQAFPLYGLIESLLATPGFMKEGGVLGVFCSHAYPHASDLAELQLPRALKGADLVVYAVLKALGVEVRILPILEFGGNYGSRNPQLGITGRIEASRRWYMSSEYMHSDLWSEFLQEGNEPELGYWDGHEPNYGHIEDIDQHWKEILLTREVRELRSVFRDGEEYNLAKKPDSFYEAGGVRLGPDLHRYFTTGRGEAEGLDEVSEDVWPAYYLPGITWITEPKHEEMAFSQIAYGNQAEVGSRYSCAAILAVIPPFSSRGNLPRKV
ncbi:2OG-Fe(II) oxygenase [Aspergillus ibericus CBS 121593]|uniref:Fe2OG dioxygenase domain-containing protein n=1 Tax=Aspergillus ibericus CBS 121593 TaxID=1448316 RepID=A0A395GIL4_9EURO|nr:hypothetical protein BO80DRAFT_394440 [Aspergillus ibericus CBS 121593]RAK95204.1 hypothetical protein BO80DRAFT_394440 [Aspergillus ibericus CBS 121593]